MPKIDTMQSPQKLKVTSTRRSVSQANRGRRAYRGMPNYLGHEAALDMILRLLRKQLRDDFRTTEERVIQW
jgi:hypothetical protein